MGKAATLTVNDKKGDQDSAGALRRRVTTVLVLSGLFLLFLVVFVLAAAFAAQGCDCNTHKHISPAAEKHS